MGTPPSRPRRDAVGSRWAGAAHAYGLERGTLQESEILLWGKSTAGQRCRFTAGHGSIDAWCAVATPVLARSGRFLPWGGPRRPPFGSHCSLLSTCTQVSPRPGEKKAQSPETGKSSSASAARPPTPPSKEAALVMATQSVGRARPAGVAPASHSPPRSPIGQRSPCRGHTLPPSRVGSLRECRGAPADSTASSTPLYRRRRCARPPRYAWRGGRWRQGEAWERSTGGGGHPVGVAPPP